jgi:hypothetical protein
MFVIDCSTFLGWQMMEKCIYAFISQKDNLLDFIWHQFDMLLRTFHVGAPGSFYMEMTCFQP